MKARLLMLGVLLALLVAAGNAQDNLDSPWGVKNADIYATNAFPVWQLPTAGGWVDTPVDMTNIAIRSGGHYEVQTVFDSEGNIYFRGSVGTDAPNNSVRIYSFTADGTFRWKSDNIFGNWPGASPIVGRNAVYGLGAEYGKTGTNSPPVVAATGSYWTASSGKAFHSHIIYSPVTNELIKVSWNDYGQTIATFDPATGAIKHQSNWSAVSMIDPLQSLESSGSWLRSNIGGHGYCDTAALLPDGTSVISAGFGGIVAMYTRDESGASHWGEFHNMASCWWCFHRDHSSRSRLSPSPVMKSPCADSRASWIDVLHGQS